MKKILQASLLVCITIGLAACGNDTATTTSETASAHSDAQVTDETLTIGVLPAESAIPIIWRKKKATLLTED